MGHNYSKQPKYTHRYTHMRFLDVSLGGYDSLDFNTETLLSDQTMLKKHTAAGNIDYSTPVNEELYTD